MIYLSGVIRADLPEIGFMCTPKTRPPPGRVWAGDNGRFTDPDSYTDEGFLRWLESCKPEGCLFATAPDVLGDHQATVDMSLPMMPRIRASGFPAAFVAQDGFDEAPWDEFDCLFIGGSTEFKLGPLVPEIVREARRRGKWTHMGRVNSYSRLRLARVIGCKSADGTFLKHAPDHNAGRMLRWLAKMEAQPTMELLQ